MRVSCFPGCSLLQPSEFQHSLGPTRPTWLDRPLGYTGVALAILVDRWLLGCWITPMSAAAIGYDIGLAR